MDAGGLACAAIGTCLRTFFIEREEIVVLYVRTCDNLADFFTKCLAPAEFFPMRDKIMNVTT